MQLFYTTDIDTSVYTLNQEESLHCIRVLRLGEGDEIFLTDGKGNIFKSVIIGNNPKRCEVKVIESYQDYEKRNYHLHIAIAPTKNIDRIEWFLEKATEIGIDEITPLICEHSERRSVNVERLNKVIIAAMKQSLKAYLPKLNKETKIEEFIQYKLTADKFIGYCSGDTKKLKDCYKSGNDAVVLIGPEGDFSEDEVMKAKENGFIPINLGNSRYRTETAAMVACHTINLMNEF
jgi:16S rRNA (uracil1498-N3)-methyltransferase